ncbi:MAG: cyclic nucleotide-binding domain-containing protein, partial [Clostridia bacterium]|nr:cyclic nucleotide-binding domain-containing protein [Clostridia bacterium]
MLRTIKNCKLFSGLQEEDIKNALSFFHSVNESFAKNTIIKKPNDILSAFGLVLSGAVTVFMDDFDGNRLVMSRAVPGETFGESLCFLQKRSQVYIMATEQTEILWLHCDTLFN